MFVSVSKQKSEHNSHCLKMLTFNRTFCLFNNQNRQMFFQTSGNDMNILCLPVTLLEKRNKVNKSAFISFSLNFLVYSCFTEI